MRIHSLSRTICILVLGLCFAGLTSDTSAQSPIAPLRRIERVAQFGGPLRAVALDHTDALVAEGDSIVRVPLLGPNAYQSTERLALPYGPLLDLLGTPQALYALSTNQLIILSPDGRQVIRTVSGGGERLNLWNNMLAVASDQAGVRLFSLKPDGDVAEVTRILSPSETAQTALIAPNLLAMADGAAGLRLISVENPTLPQPISVLNNLIPANGVATFATWIYVSTNHRLHLIDTVPSLPPRPLGHYAPLHDVRELAWLNGFILAADASDGLKVYQLDNRYQPQYVYSQLNTSAYHVAVDPQGKVILSSQPNGVSIFSAEHLPELRLLSFVPLWAAPTSISITFDGLALVSLGSGGLAVIDVAVPTYPQVLAALPFAGSVQHALVHPTYPNIFYVLLDDGRLLAVGFNPGDTGNVPVYSDIPLSGEPERIAIDPGGRTLVIAARRAGAQFFSLIAPTEPHLIATLRSLDLATPGVRRVEYAPGDSWLVLDGQVVRRLALNNGSLQELNQMPVFAESLSLTDDGFALVGGQNQLTVLGLENQQLIQQALYTAPGKITDMRALLGQIVLASPDAGLVILDTSNPAAPREQRFITPDISIDRFLQVGDDFLLISPDEGLVHVRFPTLLADQADVPAVISGKYHPPDTLQSLIPLTDGRIGLAGSDWYQFDGSTPQHLNQQSAIAGVAFGEGAILLDESGTLYRLDQQGQRVAENLQITGIALATDSLERVWLISAAGQMYTLDPMTLLPLFPPADLSVLRTPTMMIYQNERLLVGTQNGDLWSVDLTSNSIPQLLASSLGGAIMQITPTAQADRLLISAGSGGLWWVEIGNSQLQVVARYAMPARAAMIDPTSQWIALASGICGLQMLDARQPQTGVHYFADWHEGVVTDVQYFAGNWLAIVDGSLSIFEFDPNRAVALPALPYHPSPADFAEVSTQLLQWRSDDAGCHPTTYEVWIDGELAGKTLQTRWQLPEPLHRDIRWQIVAVDELGSRTIGPEWRIYAPMTGWTGSPPMLRMKIDKPEEAGAPIAVWWTLGSVFVVLGVLGLLNVLWRQFRSQITG